MDKQHSHNGQVGFKIVSTFLGPIFYKHKARLLAGLVALLGVDFFQLCIPRILKKGVDGLANPNVQQQDLLFLALLICGIGILTTILRFCWRYLIIGFSRHLERDLRITIFNHVLTMDGSFFAKYSTGSIMAHTSNDLAAVQMACGMGMVAALDAIIMSLAAITFMIFINPKLTLLALAPMPFLALATRFLSGKMHKRFDLVQEQFSVMTEFVRSSISAIRLLKAYTLESSQSARFADIGQEYVRSSIRVAIIQGLLFPVATMVGSIGMMLVLNFGGKLVMREMISMGDFVAFITYLYMLIWPIMAIGWVANLSQRGLTSLRRIAQLLTNRSQIPAGTIPCQPTMQHFSIKNLSFTYPGAQNKTLQDLSLTINSGTLGICGPTGCGKTTLCQILSRMFPVKDNTLFLDDNDINTLQQESFQQQISYVGQEALLFSSSITENIGFGLKDPLTAKKTIIQAAKAASIHDEIMQLPNGYESHIGEKGVTLSGGQRQRIAFARALACDRPIMIVDDALAAVDTATEQQILRNILPLLQGKTVVWVSQRIKQLALMERILVLENGQMSGLGSFDTLISSNSFLQEIHHRQSLTEGIRGEANA